MLSASSRRVMCSTTPFCRMARTFASRSTAPPPVATICPFSRQTSAITACSSARKAASPSWAKISGMDFPARRSISVSQSTKGRPMRLASARPMLLLPQPGMPVRIRFSASPRSRP